MSRAKEGLGETIGRVRVARGAPPPAQLRQRQRRVRRSEGVPVPPHQAVLHGVDARGVGTGVGTSPGDRG